MIATLVCGNGDQLETVQSENIHVLRALIEMFLLPMAGPGDTIEIGDPQ